MMGTWLPETCWATIRREIKNTKVISSWFYLSTLNYDARSTTHQIWIYVFIMHIMHFLSSSFSHFPHVYVLLCLVIAPVRISSLTERLCSKLHWLSHSSFPTTCINPTGWHQATETYHRPTLLYTNSIWFGLSRLSFWILLLWRWYRWWSRSVSKKLPLFDA